MEELERAFSRMDLSESDSHHSLQQLEAEEQTETYDMAQLHVDTRRLVVEIQKRTNRIRSEISGTLEDIEKAYWNEEHGGEATLRAFRSEIDGTTSQLPPGQGLARAVRLYMNVIWLGEIGKKRLPDLGPPIPQLWRSYMAMRVYLELSPMRFLLVLDRLEIRRQLEKTRLINRGDASKNHRHVQKLRSLDKQYRDDSDEFAQVMRHMSRALAFAFAKAEGLEAMMILHNDPTQPTQLRAWTILREDIVASDPDLDLAELEIPPQDCSSWGLLPLLCRKGATGMES
ncbi:hypothetical protein LTR20_008040 [Exophiala xenobiotica]|nr:hypothetical protein LTS13_002323 [Exophiala xenobiotica]KAK5399550.1 hypothetical protein LTR79_003187 [Exophiala xenobiotica]KAK5416363.1 hypothetical protein LTR90_005584 [Exophiala xenobiotica]KAK5458553.1 hypothetical protein LTR20_008040 [Exophiala xenobiotica]KAK5490953.1 hypothetical protein LTR26_003714 [Exophiala xenobiotica]